MKTRLLSFLSPLRPYAKFVAFAAVLVVFMAWASGAMKPKVEPGTVPFTRGIAIPEGTVTHEVTVAPVEDRIDVVGTVASEEQIHTSARINAYVEEVHVAAGQQVGRDDLLVTLDNREIMEELAAAEARLKQAETEYRRTLVLSERDAATAQALIAAEAAFDAARAQVDRVKVMQTYTELHSPIAGVVTDTRIEAGDLANPGQVLLAVYNPEALRLEAHVPVRLVPRLRMGQDVTLTFDEPLGRRAGRVTEIVGEIDPASRTRLVKVHIEDAGEGLLPGTFGRLWVREAARPGVKIPASAVYRIGQIEMVQVVQGNRAVRRLVRSGAAGEDQVEILAGLDEDDVILLHPVKDDRP